MGHVVNIFPNSGRIMSTGIYYCTLVLLVSLVTCKGDSAWPSAESETSVHPVCLSHHIEWDYIRLRCIKPLLLWYRIWHDTKLGHWCAFFFGDRDGQIGTLGQMWLFFSNVGAETLWVQSVEGTSHIYSAYDNIGCSYDCLCLCRKDENWLCFIPINEETLYPVFH